MPRKAPKEVIEHRITLGDYERKALTKQLGEDDLIKKINTGAKIGQTVLIGGAVVGVGLLATTAYREAAGLVDTITDIPSSAWMMTKYRLGLISLEDLVEQNTTESQEKQEAKEARKNQGILEYGFEWLLKFLLGEDMIFTKATESNNDNNNGGNTDPYLPENDEFDPNRYDPQDPFYSTSSKWYWHGALMHWMPITIYDDTYNPRPPTSKPKPKPSDGSSYWNEMERTFCDITSPDYDEELCRDVQLDKASAGF